MALLAGINAIAAFLAARELRVSHGPLAGSLMFFLEIIFFSRYLGSTLTENLGFALGALAFAILWRGARQGSMKLIWAGLFTTTMALNARAGAFFVIPAVLAWGFFYYRTHGNRWKIFLAGAILVVATGFIVNLILVKVLGSPSGMAFSNYSYSLYGLAVGNKGWSQFNIDFPGIAESQVMGIAIQQIIAHPDTFMIGMGRAVSEYFSPNWGSFSFFFLVFKNVSPILINTFLWIATISGTWVCLKQRAKPLPSLALWLMLGVFFSVPLVPPYDADRMRAYAATIPTSVALASIALGFFHQQDEPSRHAAQHTPFAPWALIISGVMIVLSTLGPIIVKIVGKSIDVMPIQCPAGQEWVAMRVSPDSIVNLVPDNQPNDTLRVDIRQNDFLISVIGANSSYTELSKALSSMNAGQSIVSGLNLADYNKNGQYGGIINLIGNSDQMASGVINGCATATTSSWLKKYNFFYLSPVNSSLQGKIETHENVLIPNIGLWVTGGIFIALILLVLCSLFNVGEFPFWKKILRLVSLLAIVSSFGYFLQKSEILPVIWKKLPLNSSEFFPAGGNMYQFLISPQWNQSDMNRSPAVILEDGVKLGTPNALNQEIIDKGMGRYVIKNGYLYFSSSDNSDPRLNQREYALFLPRPISKKIDYFVFVLFIGGLAGVLYSISSKKFWLDQLNALRGFYLGVKRREWMEGFLFGLQGLGLILIFASLFSNQLGLKLAPGLDF